MEEPHHHLAAQLKSRCRETPMGDILRVSLTIGIFHLASQMWFVPSTMMTFLQAQPEWTTQ